MILVPLEQADRYLPLHPGFPAAIAFLRGRPLGELPDGRIDLDGGAYAAVSHAALRRRAEARLETHRRFIDIQCLVTGREEMGWRPAEECRQPQGPYDPDKDIQFFNDAPQTQFVVLPGQLAIFFPDDAHAPLIGDGEVHKLVVKVPLG